MKSHLTFLQFSQRELSLATVPSCWLWKLVHLPYTPYTHRECHSKWNAESFLCEFTLIKQFSFFFSLALSLKEMENFGSHSTDLRERSSWVWGKFHQFHSQINQKQTNEKSSAIHHRQSVTLLAASTPASFWCFHFYCTNCPICLLATTTITILCWRVQQMRSLCFFFFIKFSILIN